MFLLLNLNKYSQLVVYYINIVRLNDEKKWAFLIQIYLLLLLTFVKVLQGKQNVIADILLQLPSTSLFFTIIYLFSSYALLFCIKSSSRWIFDWSVVLNT